jgi:hypothetical protein
MEYFDPDRGWRRGRNVDVKSVHVAVLVFGQEWESIIWAASNERRVWQRKEFIACYNRCEQLNDWEPLPSLRSGRPELPVGSSKPLPETIFVQGQAFPLLHRPAILDEADVILKKLPIQDLTPEERQARIDSQKEALAKYAAEHGLDWRPIGGGK